ncbi:MAG: HAMP domain-containing histidine kinase [Bacteroidetes bacterium]|nr:HAMP domain-containing histidine kinase [Bacteroidota bacterium]
MKKNTITGIIILMSISLLGIILVQVLWMKNAIEVKERQFDQAVNDALTNTVKTLAKKQSVSWVSSRIFNDTLTIDTNVDLLEMNGDNKLIIHNNQKTYTYVTGKEPSKTIHFDSDNKGVISVSEQGNKKFTFTTYDDLDSLKTEFGNEQVIVLSEFTDSLNVIVQKKISQISNRTKSMDEALTELVYEINSYDEPPETFFDKKNIQSTLAANLLDKGIDMPFDFGVYKPQSDSLTELHSDGFGLDGSRKVYQTRLFPESLFNKTDLLLLTFPDRRMHLFRSLGLLFSGSLLFTLIILITFTITIRVILRQKKISEIKSDFINNMTHEFKTPIATISLAVDSINNSKVIGNPEKIRYFTGIINEENKRMNNSVENVLQMSLIDKQDFDFRLEAIDIHELIHDVAKHLQLQLDKKQGRFDFYLEASISTLKIDRMHFTNVINNLIDNAIKYSDHPKIELTTAIAQNHFILKVKDNGQGLSREEQDKIFEKFYRVPSGNIHNVKGFGLGLSYVKAIVLSFGGTIDVDSRPGEGSTFTIRLPEQLVIKNG